MAGVPRIFEKFYGAREGGDETGLAAQRTAGAWALGKGQRARGRDARRTADAAALGLLARRQAGALQIAGAARPRSLRVPHLGRRAAGPGDRRVFHATGLLILEGYGLTETTAAVFLNTSERYRFGTVGPALDVVESRIADDGEILMRGPPVFRQYYNNPESTTEAVEPDGWFHTGDIGDIEDGFLRITDRKKDSIVTAGGKKVAPQAIENGLKAATPWWPGGGLRRQAALLRRAGDPAEEARKLVGERAGEAADKAAIQKEIDGLNAGLASFESVKRFAILPGDLPKRAASSRPK